MLGEVTGRELGAILECADGELELATVGHQEREPSHVRQPLRIDGADDADGLLALRRLRVAGGSAEHGGGNGDRDHDHGKRRDEEPERPAVHRRCGSQPAVAPVPVLPGAWSGVPSAQRGQVAEPGS